MAAACPFSTNFPTPIRLTATGRDAFLLLQLLGHVRDTISTCFGPRLLLRQAPASNPGSAHFGQVPVTAGIWPNRRRTGSNLKRPSAFDAPKIYHGNRLNLQVEIRGSSMSKTRNSGGMKEGGQKEK
jgi:hypothetical protein